MKILFNSDRKNLMIGSVFGLAAGFLCVTFSLPLWITLFTTAVLFTLNTVRIRIVNRFLCSAMPVLIAVASAVFNFILVQLCLGLLPQFASIGNAGKMRYVLNILCYLLVLFGMYALTLNINFSSLLTFAATLTLATVNNYVYWFRGSELKPSDLFAAQTALNVIGNYDLTVTAEMLLSWLLAFLWILVLFQSVQFQNQPKGPLIRLAALFVSIICAVILSASPQYISKNQWVNSGSIENGFLLNFFSHIKGLEKPEGYDDFDFAVLEQQYSQTQEPQHTPNVIVIMNEAFSDLRVYNGSLNTNIPVTPFYDSLQENTIKGEALVSIFGGTTANSEYEFLTGNTLGFLPEGAIGYQQYIKDGTYSLNTYFRSMNYQTVAMHPHWANGWMRSSVWPWLKFDEVYFRDKVSFSEENVIRGDWISDREMYTKVLDTLADKSDNEPLFLFGVTVQNHGGYTDDGYDNTISLEGYSQDYPEAEQYLSLLHESDAALEYLITSLKALDEETIVLFYGDHQPQIELDLCEELYNGSVEGMDFQQKKHTVSFLIWANYDIPEAELPLTSLNYLSNHLLEAADLPLPPYNQFLKDVEAIIPSMNAYGYYSTSSEQFLPYEEATGAEKDILGLYQNLQYHSIVEGAERSKIFFP